MGGSVRGFGTASLKQVEVPAGEEGERKSLTKAEKAEKKAKKKARKASQRKSR